MSSVLAGVAYEKAGKPAVIVVGDELVRYVETLKRSVGMPSLKVVVVPYPLGPAEEARQKAEAALSEVARSILAEV